MVALEVESWIWWSLVILVAASRLYDFRTDLACARVCSLEFESNTIFSQQHLPPYDLRFFPQIPSRRLFDDPCAVLLYLSHKHNQHRPTHLLQPPPTRFPALETHAPRQSRQRIRKQTHPRRRTMPMRHNLARKRLSAMPLPTPNDSSEGAHCGEDIGRICGDNLHCHG